MRNGSRPIDSSLWVLNLNLLVSSAIEGFYSTISLPLFFIYVGEFRISLVEYGLVESGVSLLALVNPFVAHLLDMYNPAQTSVKALLIGLHFLSFAGTFGIVQCSGQSVGILNVVLLHLIIEFSRNQRGILLEHGIVVSSTNEALPASQSILSYSCGLKVIGKLVSSVTVGRTFSKYKFTC